MPGTLTILIIVIPVTGFLVERILNYLNNTMWSDSLPAELKGICPDDDYKKTRLYDRENNKLSFVSSAFNLSVIIVMIIAGGFSFIDNVASSISNNPVVIALIFFGLIGIGSDIINLPFSWYDTFVIEKNFGFNKTTPLVFITDHLKGWLLAIVIGTPVLGFITWFYYKTGDDFWIWAWVLITLFSVFMSMFYSELIVPLFNKQSPLPDGSLKSKISVMAKKAGFRLSNIFIIDGSKRSTKSNAYFSGFGHKKRIVLFDNLTNDLSEDEIVAVLAHEIGHYKKRHVLQAVVLSVLTTGLMLWLFSLVVSNPALPAAIGSEKASFHMGLVVFGILYSPASAILALLTGYFSRRNEFAADEFAKTNDSGSNLAQALKKLAVKNLSNLNPHPLYVVFHYSHPPLLKRLEKLK